MHFPEKQECNNRTMGAPSLAVLETLCDVQGIHPCMELVDKRRTRNHAEVCLPAPKEGKGINAYCSVMCVDTGVIDVDISSIR